MQAWFRFMSIAMLVMSGVGSLTDTGEPMLAAVWAVVFQLWSTEKR